MLFQQHGYWVRQGYKVDLTKEEKNEIGTPSMPRPEIDILAYKPKENELLWIECKSYLDSYGVRASSFADDGNDEKRYKVFTRPEYRRIISSRLLIQTYEIGLTLREPVLRYGLATGKIYKREADDLKQLFKSNGWFLYTPEWILEQLKVLSRGQYENNVATMVAKLIYRSNSK
jgi:hypothetical protein